MVSTQQKRLWYRTAFFALFVLAPPLDILRLDLYLGHFILFGQHWTLGIDALAQGTASPGETAMNIILRGFLPLALIVGTGVWVSWKYGRLYCGWLCPHFSVVEAINALMRRAWGRPTLWEKHSLPTQLPDGRNIVPKAGYWISVILAVFGFSFLWALSLLTYLLPPDVIYHNLLTGDLTRNQSVFLSVATVLLMIEFTFARHLFCRFGCAIGLFQSLVWMANKRAMVVGFNRSRVESCTECNAACDNACPMRLNPRSIKRHMFTCTQCGQCLEACEQVQANRQQTSLMKWVSRDCALDVSDRDFGRKPDDIDGCYELKHPIRAIKRQTIKVNG